MKESCGESMVLCPRGFLSASITQSSMGVLTFFLLLLLEVGYCFSCFVFVLFVLGSVFRFYVLPLLIGSSGDHFLLCFSFSLSVFVLPLFIGSSGDHFLLRFSFSLSVFVFPDCPSGDHLLCSLRQTLQPVGWVCLWASNLSHFSRGFQSSSVRVCSLPEDFLSSCLDVTSIHCLGW